jgi:hypothetical protein
MRAQSSLTILLMILLDDESELSLFHYFIVELVPSTQRSIFRAWELRQWVKVESIHNQSQKVGGPCHDCDGDVIGHIW